MGNIIRLERLRYDHWEKISARAERTQELATYHLGKLAASSCGAQLEFNFGPDYQEPDYQAVRELRRTA